DYVLTGYGTGAIMAVPAEDERDHEFAERFELPVIRTVQPPEDFTGGAWTGDGITINSASAELDLNGLSQEEAKRRATEFVTHQGFGRARTTYRLRDWLFSRQRYWGEPFPIVYDPADPETPIALPESMLPVDLPDGTDFPPKTFDPMAGDTEPTHPAAGGPARRHRLLPQDLRSDGRGHRAADPAVPRGRLGRGGAGSGRGPEDVPARDQHDAAVGRVLLVPPALHRPHRGRRAGAARERGLLARGPRGRRRGRRGPVRGRGRARGAPPAVRAVLAQGPLRPR